MFYSMYNQLFPQSALHTYGEAGGAGVGGNEQSRSSHEKATGKGEHEKGAGRGGNLEKLGELIALTWTKEWDNVAALAARFYHASAVLQRIADRKYKSM